MENVLKIQRKKSLSQKIFRPDFGSRWVINEVRFSGKIGLIVNEIFSQILGNFSQILIISTLVLIVLFYENVLL